MNEARVKKLKRHWRTRIEKNSALKRRMWQVLQRTGGWWQWNWPRIWMNDAVERSTA